MRAIRLRILLWTHVFSAKHPDSPMPFYIELKLEPLSYGHTLSNVHLDIISNGSTSDWFGNCLTFNALLLALRYTLPESAYHSYYKGLSVFRDKNMHKGISTQEAAKDIGDGLSKAKPARFLYTGAECRLALFYAFIQHWVSNSYAARLMGDMFGLSARYAPSETLHCDMTKAQQAIALTKEE